jgi:hypothetical protein
VAKVVNVAFSDEAANTTTVPDRASEAGAAAEAFFEELHAEGPSATTTAVTRTADGWRFIDSPKRLQ